ncbi:hypothetical protein jhhlp_008254 [Lomentospora prolificans]|uniref:Uncharacterized protein n=1 Tax=Lomentospora prolificans TaxID=41688 RepID=A0A2N3MXI8_9PEZI|nr:hypothetical protein jhhlp_008254 [Lomentospora prolificans]
MTTSGYFAVLLSIAAQSLYPRAKFLKILSISIISSALSFALCCLGIFCAVKAREHNNAASIQGKYFTYNPDAAAVSGVFLFFMIWIGNTFRAWKPSEYQDPGVCFSLLAVVVLTRTSSVATFEQGFDFLWRISKAFLVGFAMATGVSLFILPSTSRGGVFSAIQGYAVQTQDALQALAEFVNETPADVLLATPAQLDTELQPIQTVQTLRTAVDTDHIGVVREKITKALNSLNALDAQMQTNLGYAKIEVAWGKLSAADLEKISELLRKLLLTLSGLVSFPMIIDHFLEIDETLPVVESARTSTFSTGQTSANARKTVHIVQGLRMSLDELALLTRVGLQYFINELEIIPDPWLPPYRNQAGPAEPEEIELDDIDGESIHLDAKSPEFLDAFGRCLKDISRRKKALEQLVKHSEEADGSAEDYSGIQHEYCLALYLFYMEDLVADAIYSLVAFAKSKVDDGTMSHSRLIYPTFLEWYRHDGEPREDPSVYSDFSQPRDFEGSDKVADPSHLAPASAWERWVVTLARIPRFLGSDLSMFGLRVAAASLCLGIVALLQNTQEFFIRQRGVWAMIVVVLGMSPTSGQTLFGFFSRILATLAAVALSFFSWYIAVGHAAGVLVFLYISNIILFYIYVKMPKYFGTSVIAIITLNVAIGYEVNANKLGREASEANGQPYYPIYLFSPYKFVAVSVGCAVSFIWVVFPYPITAKSRVPKLMGQSLFNLGRIYSAMHTTIELWINSHQSPPGGTNTAVIFPQEELRAISSDLYKKQVMSLEALKMHSHFATYEPPVGGKFPARIYDGMIAATQQSLSIVTLMAHIGRTMSFETSRHSASDSVGPRATDGTSEWVSNLAAAALESTDFQSHTTTALLCHLGAALMSGQPLPPFLAVSESFPLAKQLQRSNDELLHIKNARYPAFVAFIALEVLRTTFNKELKLLLDHTRILVGEVKFNINAV